MARKPVSKKLRRAVLERHGWRCAYCGDDVRGGNPSVDHIHPVYLGGDNDPANLIASCRFCNQRKATYSVEQFRIELTKLMGRQLRRNATLRLAQRLGLLVVNDGPVVFHFEKPPPEPTP